MITFISANQAPANALLPRSLVRMSANDIGRRGIAIALINAVEIVRAIVIRIAGI